MKRACADLFPNRDLFPVGCVHSCSVSFQTGCYCAANTKRGPLRTGRSPLLFVCQVLPAGQKQIPVGREVGEGVEHQDGVDVVLGHIVLDAVESIPWVAKMNFRKRSVRKSARKSERESRVPRIIDATFVSGVRMHTAWPLPGQADQLPFQPGVSAQQIQSGDLSDGRSTLLIVCQVLPAEQEQILVGREVGEGVEHQDGVDVVLGHIVLDAVEIVPGVVEMDLGEPLREERR